MAPQLDALRASYQQLFDTCVASAAHTTEIGNTANRIAANQARYAAVGEPLGIPWYFIGLIHCMECSLRFDQHLHNGDPLTARTVQVPAGRPTTGQPPFTWEDSATDALTYEGFANQADWSLPALLYRLEKYNGFGYRNHGINTPYLWSFSNQYTKGKYGSDGNWSPDLVSQQCGAATLLRSLIEKGAVTLDGAPGPANADTIAQLAADVPYDPHTQSDAARKLQNALNTIDGISLTADGYAGQQTSDAVQSVTGHYLDGDPRA